MYELFDLRWYRPSLLLVIFSLFYLLEARVEAASVDRSYLEYLELQINGAKVVARNKEEITVFLGDTVQIGDAVLTNGKSAEIVNLVGFKNSKVGNPYDDRFKKIDVTKDLNKRWAVGTSQNLYRIVVRSRSWMHGQIVLKVERPELEKVLVSLSGIDQMVRSGETIFARSSDQLKVKEFYGNFDTDDKNFRFEIKKDGINAKLVFSRYGFNVTDFPIAQPH